MIHRLVIISPCRDEAQFVETTLRSVIHQTRRPDRWVIVDDDSRDATAEIVARYVAEQPWIELVRRQRGGERQLGPGVVAAFNAGLAHLADDPFEVISKLDCDLEFGPECFAAILRQFDDEQVGMASGTTSLKLGTALHSERYTAYHVPGQAKFYRRACFEQIGGLQPIYGWDIIDETDARRHGWKTVSDPTVEIIHHRLQGAALGTLRGRVIWGHGAYAIGSHPLFALARGLYRMAEHPWLIGGLAFIWGFFSSYLNPDIQRTRDPDLIRYLRQEQRYRMLHANQLPPRKSRQ